MAYQTEWAPSTAPFTTTTPSLSVQHHLDGSNSEAILWAQVSAFDECSTTTFQQLPEFQARPSTPSTDLLSVWLSTYMSTQTDASTEPPANVPAFMNTDLGEVDLGVWDHTSCIPKTPVHTLPRLVPMQARGADLSPCSPLAFGMQSDRSPGASHSSWPATTSTTIPAAWNSISSSATPFPVPEPATGVVLSEPPARRELFLSHSAPASTHYSHQSHHSRDLIHDSNAFGRPGYKQVSASDASMTFSAPNANCVAATPDFVAASRPSSSQQLTPIGSVITNHPLSNGQQLMLPRRGLYSEESRQVFSAAAASATTSAPGPSLTSFGSRVGSIPSWNTRAIDPRGKDPIQTGGSSTSSRKRINLAVDPSGEAASLWNSGASSETETWSTGAGVASGEVFKLGPALNTNGKPRARSGCATHPQSVSARHRREKINDRMKILQGLIPNGTKVDTAAMLDEAHSYVKFLEHQIELLTSDENWKLATPTIYKGMDLSQPQHRSCSCPDQK